MRDAPEILTYGREAAMPALADRPLWTSIGRGFLCRCPSCGRGKLFKGYLTSVQACSACGEELGLHRADDLPPYLTILVVGHVVLTLFMAMDETVALSMWAHLAVFVPLTLVLSLALLRPMKGATIGLQWAKRMHGFGDPDENRDH